MNPSHLQLSSYHYELPPELMAQSPVIPRDSSRLLVVDSHNTSVHSCFKALPQWLKPGDLLVLNNTRVVPARLYGRKTTGAPVEVLLLKEVRKNCWLCLVKPGKRFKLGTEVCFSRSREPEGKEEITIWAKVIERDDATGGRLIEFQVPEGTSLMALLEEIGYIPFPPYLAYSQATPEQYQTVYAETPGAAAAPTAGLHFTEELLTTLKKSQIGVSYITLHVGVGTFRPVEVDNITEHTMHSEWLELPQETVAQIKATREAGGRVIAVGTTVVRALEGVATKEAQEREAQEREAQKKETMEGERESCGCDRAEPQPPRILSQPFVGETNLFIYPGYQWKIIDGMITNFHLPRSSLLMLVSALIGRERLLSLYEEAIKEKYRFYSFGDAMLILPEATIKGN